MLGLGRELQYTEAERTGILLPWRHKTEAARETEGGLFALERTKHKVFGTGTGTQVSSRISLFVYLLTDIIPGNNTYFIKLNDGISNEYWPGYTQKKLHVTKIEALFYVQIRVA